MIDYKKVAQIALKATIFTIIFISLVVVVNNFSFDKIKQNEKNELLNELTQLVQGFDNDILASAKTINIDLYGSKRDIVMFLAKKEHKLIAKLIKHTYPKGYSGDITILTAVDNNYKIIGSRILKHTETPGLGDKIEIKKSPWMLGFNGVGLNDKIWSVKKRGGDFDSWSGATITPQAIVNALHELLIVLQAKQL